MKNIVLLASNGNNVGKSESAKQLIAYLNKGLVYSFANPIKMHADDLFKILFPNHDKTFNYYYSNRDTKNDLMSEYIDIPSFSKSIHDTFRKFLSDISTDLKNNHGNEIWAHYAYEFIKQSKDDLIVIDDFRTPIEVNYLKYKLSDCNIITVYLDKSNIKNQVQTSYEGLLRNYPFDLEFTFKEDYSNSKELLTTISNNLI